ncbi:MAG: transcriptional repressor [Rhodospirillales bacterium]|nr:transcriptional repressor [Rhodospirillales bacterium]
MPHDAATHHRDIPSQLKAAEQACAENGAQLTALRRDVLALILQAETPVTAYQLLDRLKPIRKSAVPPTIYRSLEFLLENKLIHKIERLNAFVPCAEADHHHADAQFLICKACGAVIEIEDHGVSEALTKAAAKHGFSPTRAVVEVEGLCAACAANPS